MEENQETEGRKEGGEENEISGEKGKCDVSCNWTPWEHDHYIEQTHTHLGPRDRRGRRDHRKYKMN